MAVIFDEVITQVEETPPATAPPQEQAEQQSTPATELRNWQRHQALVRRRRQRLEAD